MHRSVLTSLGLPPVRRQATLVTLLAAASLGVTALATPAAAAPTPTSTSGPTPTSTTTSTSTTTPTPTLEPIPPLPTVPPPPPAPAYCSSYDPTSPGDCIITAQTYTETITYPDPANPGHMITAYVPAIRPLTQVNVETGPSGDRQTMRISVPSVCAYYRTYTGARLATYPAPDVFRATRPRTYWIRNADNPNAKTRSFIQMQLPNGIGKVEAPYQGFYRKKTHMGLTETYDDWIHLDYYNPAAYDDAYNHMNDNVGYWWDYQCSFARYRNITNTQAPEWLKDTLRRLHADNPHWWEFWQPGQEDPPPVPNPTLPLPSLLKLVIPGLDLGASPPYDKSLVSLPQFLYVTDAIGKYPITISVGTGANRQTATAVPGPLKVYGLPNDAKSSLACTDGGNPNARSTSDSDCWLQFAQATAKGQPLSLTFHQDWKISVNDKPVAGPTGTVTKTAKESFTIRQEQAIGGS